MALHCPEPIAYSLYFVHFRSHTVDELAQREIRVHRLLERLLESTVREGDSGSKRHLRLATLHSHSFAETQILLR